MTKENIIQEKSYQFALDVIKLIRSFPHNTEGFHLAKQVIRSATSIGANVEEALGSYTKNEFTFKMSIALKEARETHYWLRLVRDSGIIKQDVEPYINEVEEIRKILTAIVKKSKGD